MHAAILKSCVNKKTIILLALIISTKQLESSDYKIYLLAKENGLFLSINEGRSWSTYNKGLPKNIKPVRLFSNSKHLFLSTYDTGLFRFNNEEKQWESINSPEFRNRSIYSKGEKYRKITAFASDMSDPDHLVIATKHTIYSSNDCGKNWIKVPMRGLDQRNYITALALVGNRIFVGTSFNGIYVLNNGAFMQKNRGLPNEPYSGDLSFIEQIISLNCDGDNIFAGTDFGKGLYTAQTKNNEWQQMPIPHHEDSFARLHDIQGNKNILTVAFGGSIYWKKSATGKWHSRPVHDIIKSLPKNMTPVGAFLSSNNDEHPPLFLFLYDDKKSVSSNASHKKAIYASIPAISRNLNHLMLTIKRCRFNAVVIDMKDDFGDLYFPTNLKTAHEVNSARRPVDIHKIIKKLHAENIYAIARIVVFKDKRVFFAYNNKYSIRNVISGLPWRGNEREYWVDPHARFIHQYTIDISKELQDLGFDEIQYDYIRFPSDGPVHLCRYSYKEDPETYKSEILSDFLLQAKAALRIPVSVDIYGFNSWYYFGNWIGQDMEAFSNIVDVICPMVYPSHFGSRYYHRVNPEERPYRIVYDGGIRAMKLARGTAVIRPYIQAFRLLSPTWGPGYIQKQAEGAEMSGCSGYTFWNAKGDYVMVMKALGD